MFDTQSCNRVMQQQLADQDDRHNVWAAAGESTLSSALLIDGNLHANVERRRAYLENEHLRRSETLHLLDGTAPGHALVPVIREDYRRRGISQPIVFLTSSNMFGID